MVLNIVNSHFYENERSDSNRNRKLVPRPRFPVCHCAGNFGAVLNGVGSARVHQKHLIRIAGVSCIVHEMHLILIA